MLPTEKVDKAAKPEIIQGDLFAAPDAEANTTRAEEKPKDDSPKTYKPGDTIEF